MSCEVKGWGAKGLVSNEALGRCYVSGKPADALARESGNRMKKIRSLANRIASCLMLIVLGETFAKGCGMSSVGLIDGKYSEIDREGHLALSYPLESLRLDADVSIPVNLYFTSAPGAAETLFGKGWFLPIFDSSIVQVGENEFQLLDPVGGHHRLHRSAADKNLLQGVSWSGQIDGNNSVLLYSCDGWRVRYKSGRLAEIQHNQKIIVCDRGSDKNTVRLLVDGKSIAALQRDPADATKSRLTLQRTVYELQFGERPIVESIQGRRVVSRISTILTGIKQLGADTGSAEAKRFKFGVDKQLQPTVVLSSGQKEDRLYTWDAASGALMSDGHWYYVAYGDMKDPFAPWMASRFLMGDTTKCDYWYDDPGRGINLTRVDNGPLVKTTRFASGMLFGKIRKIEEIDSRTVKITSLRSYDENGRLIAVRNDSDEMRISHEGDYEKLEWFTQNQKQWTKRFYQGTLREISYSDGAKISILTPKDKPALARFQTEAGAVELPLSEAGIDTTSPLSNLELQ